VSEKTLQVGDEIKCPRCNTWHRIFVKYPDERASQGRAELYFNCSKATTSFHAGRVGDPPRDPSRWRQSTDRSA
jgi:DNA-directed RNA polymerase subunit RPC12/RpoP